MPKNRVIIDKCKLRSCGSNDKCIAKRSSLVQLLYRNITALMYVELAEPAIQLFISLKKGFYNMVVVVK